MGKWMFAALGALAWVVFLAAQASAEGAISPREAARWMKEKADLQLIDVRTRAEYANGHIARAKLIPLQELESRLAEIDKAKPLLLYCHNGHRSANALKMLSSKGYTQAKDIEGGIKAWQDAGLPIAK